MIIGRFGDTSGAPYVEAWLRLPNRNIGARISFLIDTGADSTTLMPMDGRNIRLNYGRLSRTGEATGLGGKITTFLEDALVTFLDEDRHQLVTYRILMDIVPPDPDLQGVASLLGREILDRW